MKRRGNNEGSIYRRKDGRWEARIVVGYKANGQPKRKSIYGETRRDVAEQLNSQLNDKQQGLLSDPKGHTLGSYLAEWLEIRSNDVAPTTTNTYRCALKKFDPLGRLPLDQLSPFQVEQVYASMLREGLSPRTVQISHSTLYSALQDAVRWRLLPRNCMNNVKAPRQRRKEIKVWTAGEITRFLEFTRHHRLYALFYLALCTGMRRAELLALQWDDVSVEEGRAGRILVRRNLVSANGTIVIKEPKTAASRRDIYVSDDVLEVLNEHRRRQAADRALLGEAWSLDEVVFSSEVGGYLDPNNLSRSFRRLVKKAEVTDVGLHALRHTHASILIKQGFDPKVISERLGHTSVAFTQTIYQHLYEEQRTRAAIGLGDLLS